MIQYCLKLCPDFLTLNPLLTKYLMKPTSYEADKLIEESKQLCIKYTALKNVSVLIETIVPPYKPTAFNLEGLGIFLINVYKHCKDISRNTIVLHYVYQLTCTQHWMEYWKSHYQLNLLQSKYQLLQLKRV